MFELLMTTIAFLAVLVVWLGPTVWWIVAGAAAGVVALALAGLFLHTRDRVARWSEEFEEHRRRYDDEHFGGG